MKLLRFKTREGKVLWGSLEATGVRALNLIAGPPLHFQETSDLHELNSVELISPFEPHRLIGIGNNFQKGESDKLTPVIFEKRLSSLVPAGSKVQLPADCDTWGEPEIGIVMKRSGKKLTKFIPEDYILGFCLINDTTCLSRLHAHDSHTDEAKSRPGFCQLGPFIETEFSYASAEILGLVNGKLYRKGSTSKMKWDLERVIREASNKFELHPFDVIFTGCPERVSDQKSFLKPDDSFLVRVDGLGELVTYFLG